MAQILVDLSGNRTCGLFSPPDYIKLKDAKLIRSVNETGPVATIAGADAASIKTVIGSLPPGEWSGFLIYHA